MRRHADTKKTLCIHKSTCAEICDTLSIPVTCLCVCVCVCWLALCKSFVYFFPLYFFLSSVRIQSWIYWKWQASILYSSHEHWNSIITCGACEKDRPCCNYTWSVFAFCFAGAGAAFLLFLLLFIVKSLITFADAVGVIDAVGGARQCYYNYYSFYYCQCCYCWGVRFCCYCFYCLFLFSKCFVWGEPEIVQCSVSSKTNLHY